MCQFLNHIYLQVPRCAISFAYASMVGYFSTRGLQIKLSFTCFRCTPSRAKCILFFVVVVTVLYKMPSFFELTLDECSRLRTTGYFLQKFVFHIYTKMSFYRAPETSLLHHHL